MTVYLPITVDLCNPYPLTVMNIPRYNTGRGALITLTAAGAVVVPDKESLYIYVKKSDGTVAYANCSLQGTQIKADFDEQMTAVAGVMDVEIQMVDSSGNSITTTIFKINVMTSNIDYQKITSSDEFLTLVSALTEVNELKKNGLKGDPGKAATLQIGTVVASDPGSDPEVTNSGTEQNAVLNFVLPRGIPGPQGPAIDTVNPTEATESDSGKAADAYQTKLALDEQNVKIQNIEDTDILNGLYIGSNYTVNTPPTKKGIRVFASSSASGAPVPGTSLGIQIWTGNTTVVQVMFSSSAIHFRRSSDGGTTWGSWYKCSGTEV